MDYLGSPATSDLFVANQPAVYVEPVISPTSPADNGDRREVLVVMSCLSCLRNAERKSQ